METNYPLEDRYQCNPMSAMNAVAGISSSSNCSDSGSPSNGISPCHRGRCAGDVGGVARRHWRRAKSHTVDCVDDPAAAAAAMMLGSGVCSINRYSQVPMRAFLADKDWKQLVGRRDSGKLAKCRLSGDKYSRMLHSYHRLYQEYQYICACLLPQPRQQQPGLDRFDSGGHNDNPKGGGAVNTDSIVGDSVILPDRNFQVRTCRKRRSTICRRVLTRDEDGAAVWMNVPIVVELLLPRLQEQIQAIVNSCPHVSDPLEVLAELRACRYDTERCVKYLRQTLPLRSVVRDILCVRSSSTRAINPASNIADSNVANSSSTVAAAAFSMTAGDPADSEFSGRPLLRGVRRLRADLRVMRASLASVSTAMASGLSKISSHLTAQQERQKRQQLLPQHQSQQQQQEHSAALCQMQKCLEELRQKCLEEESRRRLAYNALQEQLGNIRVYCRCTKVDGDQAVEAITQEQVRVRTNQQQQQPPQQQHQEEVFRFDRVFGPDAPQEALFEELRPLITSFLDGYNVCFITYGGEASGKTFTLLGSAKQRGLVYRALLAVLQEASSRSSDWSMELDTACLEIYNDACFDLLSDRAPVSLYKDCSLASAFATLRLAPIKEERDVAKLLHLFTVKRRVAKTALNPRSSRSHLIHLVRLQARSRVHGRTTCSYLGMMDLAGAENIVKADTWHEPERAAEAGHINRSLAAFNRLFLTLRRTPPGAACYREARLTQMLKPFLVNHGKCCIIVTVRTDSSSTSGSLSTLRFGRDARQVALGKAQRQLLAANVD